jgi:NAD(P)-dependent dehydrogenase (short-subunit alcohol dehydrogenase family)
MPEADRRNALRRGAKRRKLLIGKLANPMNKTDIFHGHTVLVTGGARGIGRACVIAFASRGARVVLNFRSSVDEAKALAASSPGQILPIQADVSREEDVRRLFDEATGHGWQPTVVVNNAGIVNREKFPDVSADRFLHILAVNTVAPYLIAREFALRLQGAPGVIVNIGSMRAFAPTTVDYSASKAALHNLTVSLAKTLAPAIRVNAVAPGFTETDMHQGNHDRLEAEGRKSPLQRVSTPEDIAEAVVFLASDRARSITGQILLVDNGRSLA